MNYFGNPSKWTVVTFFCSWSKVKINKNKWEISFLYSFIQSNFFLEGGAVTPNIPQLRHPHYIPHTKYIQKVDKTMIYVVIGNESDIREPL